MEHLPRYREDQVRLDIAREIAESDWAAANPDKVKRCPEHPPVLMVERLDVPGSYRCRLCGPNVRHFA